MQNVSACIDKKKQKEKNRALPETVLRSHALDFFSSFLSLAEEQ
jgi:hypothetical protein